MFQGVVGEMCTSRGVYLLKRSLKCLGSIVGCEDAPYEAVGIYTATAIIFNCTLSYFTPLYSQAKINTWCLEYKGRDREVEGGRGEALTPEFVRKRGRAIYWLHHNPYREDYQQQHSSKSPRGALLQGRIWGSSIINDRGWTGTPSPLADSASRLASWYSDPSAVEQRTCEIYPHTGLKGINSGNMQQNGERISEFYP